VAPPRVDGLDERAPRAQEPLLGRHRGSRQRDFGKIQTLAQQVDAHQNVEEALAQSRMISTRSTVSMSECR